MWDTGYSHTRWNIDHLDRTPVQAEQIEKWTHVLALRRVLHNILYGWEDKNSDENICPYFNRLSELSTHNGCILWESWVVVPKQGRTKLLDLLHQGHPGMVRMKHLPRSYIWWLRLDNDIEQQAHKYSDCQNTEFRTCSWNGPINRGQESMMITRNHLRVSCSRW
jgi:hypothetical protein